MNNPLVQPDPGLYIWTILTFLVLMALLARFAWRPLLEALERRQRDIRQSLDDARQARQELERVHAESAKILADARIKAEEILTTTREDAYRFRDELKEKARIESDRLVQNAQREIQQETDRARQLIRRDAIDISVEIASKLLQRHINTADDQRLIEQTIGEIGQRPS